MNIEVTTLTGALLVGCGATLVMDLWALFLRRALGIASLNYCLVGRWLCHMPGGVFVHANIAASAEKPAECTTGWIAHYLVGAVFALLLVLSTSGRWLEEPTLVPALLVGIGTVIIPFFVMQPALGLGVAGARTPDPNKTRLKSIMSHGVFGAGLYVCALAAGPLLRTWP